MQDTLDQIHVEIYEPLVAEFPAYLVGRRDRAELQLLAVLAVAAIAGGSLSWWVARRLTGRVGGNADRLSGSSEELAAVSAQVAAASEDTAVQANVVAAAGEQVSHNVQTVATAVEEMSASVREIAASSADA